MSKNESSGTSGAPSAIDGQPLGPQTHTPSFQIDSDSSECSSSDYSWTWPYGSDDEVMKKKSPRPSSVSVLLYKQYKTNIR
jgi:hypothetical protein